MQDWAARMKQKNKITDADRAKWLLERAGIDMTGFVKHGLWPEFFDGEQIRLIVDAAIEKEDYR